MVVVENEPPEADIDDVAAKGGNPDQVPDARSGRGRLERLDWKLSSTKAAFPPGQGTDEAGVCGAALHQRPAGTYPSC